MSGQGGPDVQRDAIGPGAAVGQGSAEFTRLAAALEAARDQIAALVLERVRGSLPSWVVENPVLWEEVRRFARASLRIQLNGFRRAILPDHCPEVDVARARAAARVGGLKALLDGYRIAQMSLWERWLDLVEGSVTDAEERHELLRRGSEYFFRYAGLLSNYVTDVYQQELERAARDPKQRRFHAITGLLEGDPLAGAQLDHDLERYHFGFVAWGPEGEALARELALALARPILIVGVLDQNWWGWASGSRPLDAGKEDELKNHQPPAGTGLAFGLEAFGETGFRATNRQALRARWVARRAGRSLVFYADVAVEALASDNEADARAFVAHELRGIDDDSAASLRIRETIVAYFAAQHNAASAAAALGVHQQTVANRLRAAEERLGHPVGTRRVELETALRLRRLERSR